MGTFVSNRDAGGKTNEEGHFRLPLKVWQGSILEGLEVVQNASPNMTVTITKGDGQIARNDYSHAVWTDANTTGVTVTTADGVNPRLDRVVAYVDRGMSFTGSDTNNPGALKFKVVAGTPASTPSLPNDTVVQTAVTAGNPWIELATILVPANSTDVVTSRITDTRVFFTSRAITRAMYPVGSIYINAVNSANPYDLFGFGTWVAFGSGRVPVGVDAGQAEFATIGQMGGEKTVALTGANNGPHSHTIGNLFMPQGTGSLTLNDRNGDRILTSDNTVNGVNGEIFGGTRPTNADGSGTPHNNLQPYITVYMWRRTA